MQVRHLSRDALWIEIEPSPRTSLLVWRAMESSGLRNGRINTPPSNDIGPVHEWQRSLWEQNLVEGRTAQGLFAANIKIQAKLTGQDSGTLVEFAARNIWAHIDFGAATRTKRRLMPLIEECLREAPANWQLAEGESEVGAPLASPHNSASPMPHSLPRFEVILPLSGIGLPTAQRVRMFGGCFFVIVGGCGVGYFQLLGPFCLGLAGWELWKLCKRQSKGNWYSFIVYALIGLYNSWLLIQ